MGAETHRGASWVPSFIEFSKKKAEVGTTADSPASGNDALEYIGEMSAALSYVSKLHGYQRISALLDAVVAEAASSRGKSSVAPLPGQAIRKETK